MRCLAMTVGAPVRVRGIGLHTGERCAVRVLPAEAGAGIVFSSGAESTPAHWSLASAPGGSTRLGGWLETPEHLLAALTGVGITDVCIEVEGGEIPGLDGSALPWVEALGRPVVTGEVQVLCVGEPVEVSLGEGVARLLPCERLEIAVEVDFGPSLRGRFEGGLHDFVEGWCWARTFLAHRELDRVRDAGRGRGAGPGSVVVWGERGALVPLRSVDEPIRHKALDALGDLALAGAPVRGRLEVTRGTHALHHAMVRAWLGPPGTRA